LTTCKNVNPKSNVQREAESDATPKDAHQDGVGNCVFDVAAEIGCGKQEIDLANCEGVKMRSCTRECQDLATSVNINPTSPRGMEKQ